MAEKERLFALKSNMDSLTSDVEDLRAVEWTPASGDTLLDFILSINRTALPFSFIKKGAITVSDTPYTTQEFTGIVYGYGDRIHVSIKDYGSSTNNVEYSRDIWQSAWNESNWNSMNTWRPIISKKYTASATRTVSSGALISITANEFKDNSNNSASIPDGYTPVGFTYSYPGSSAVSLVSVNLFATGTDVMVIYKAHSSISNASMTSYLTITYMKS